MFDCEAIAHVEIPDPCIICFEDVDYAGAAPVCSHNVVISRDCACKYMIHRSCWEKWRVERPRRQKEKGIRCLVCASPVERRRSRGEIISEMLARHHVETSKVCRLFIYFLGIVTVIVIACGPFN